MKGFLKDSSLLSRLFLLILVFLILSSFGIIFGGLIVGNDLSDPSAIRILQTIQSLFSFMFPALLLAYLWSEKPVKYLCLDKGINYDLILLCILAMVAIIPFINLLSELNHNIKLPGFLAETETRMKLNELKSLETTQKVLQTNNIGGLLRNITLVAIIPAFSEELFFRGTLFRFIKKYMGVTAAVWLSGFIFSIAHGKFYGIIPLIVLGAFLGYLLVWSKSIWLPILAHFINNAIIVIFNFLTSNGYITFNIDTIGTGDFWWLGLISGVIFIAVTFLLIRQSGYKSKQSLSVPE